MQWLIYEYENERKKGEKIPLETLPFAYHLVNFYIITSISSPLGWKYYL